MVDIFLSYASEDIVRVKTLAKALEEQGWSVLWDRKILPGKTSSQVIKEAVKAAKCVVVLWSNLSVKSDRVLKEAVEGDRRNILVPVRIDMVDIPHGFIRIQTVDLTNWNGETDHFGFDTLSWVISEVIRFSC